MARLGIAAHFFPAPGPALRAVPFCLGPAFRVFTARRGTATFLPARGFAARARADFFFAPRLPVSLAGTGSVASGRSK